MRKKFICIAAACLLTVSCGEKSEETLSAEAVFPETEAAELLGFEPKATFEKSYAKSTVRYDSDPLGGDPLIVELYVCNDKTSGEDIRADFLERKENRSDSEEVEGFNAEAFIAYPSINVYRDGCMVTITAGSGADDTQKELLKKAGKIAAESLENYFKE